MSEPKPIAVKPGDIVLIGRPGVSMPADWWVGTVLWCDKHEVLVRQGGYGGGSPHRALHPADYVRATGTTEQLVAFRARCNHELSDLIAAANEAKTAAADRAAAVYRRLDEIADSGSQL